MLILLILEQFEQYHKNPFNPMYLYKDNINDFKMAWVEYCEGKEIHRINKVKLIDFLKHLGKTLGF